MGLGRIDVALEQCRPAALVTEQSELDRSLGAQELLGLIEMRGRALGLVLIEQDAGDQQMGMAPGAQLLAALHARQDAVGVHLGDARLALLGIRAGERPIEPHQIGPVDLLLVAQHARQHVLGIAEAAAVGVRVGEI